MTVPVSEIMELSEGEVSVRKGARGSVVGRGTILQAGRSPVRVPEGVDFFSVSNPKRRIMALGSTRLSL
jgi:hypothetical protein